MHGVDKVEKAVLGLLNQHLNSGLSKEMLWRTLYHNKGISKELALKAINTLENKNYILKLGSRDWYKINPESEFKLFPEEYEKILPNLKAVNLIINTYNEAYYPSITFEEYINDHLKGKVERSVTKKILLLAKRDNYIKDLPIDSNKKFELERESLNLSTSVSKNKKRFFNFNYKPIFHHLYDKYIIPIIGAVIAGIILFSILG
jgi:hypothetical protein